MKEPKRYFAKLLRGELMSSGQRKRKLPFNDTIIKDGKVVRIRKDGTVKAILGTLADMRKNK
jgi:hypothetical protein